MSEWTEWLATEPPQYPVIIIGGTDYTGIPKDQVFAHLAALLVAERAQRIEDREARRGV